MGGAFWCCLSVSLPCLLPFLLGEFHHLVHSGRRPPSNAWYTVVSGRWFFRMLCALVVACCWPRILSYNSPSDVHRKYSGPGPRAAIYSGNLSASFSRLLPAFLSLLPAWFAELPGSSCRAAGGRGLPVGPCNWRVCAWAWRRRHGGKDDEKRGGWALVEEEDERRKEQRGC